MSIKIGPLKINVPALAAGVGAGILGGPATGYAVYRGVQGLYDAAAQQKLNNQARQTEQDLALQYADYAGPAALQANAAAAAYANALNRQGELLRQAAEQAKLIAGENADLLLQEGAELLRRRKLEQKALESSTAARLWASGTIANTGSQQVFQKTLKKENEAERAWIQKSFESQAGIVREGGQLQANQLTAEALGIGAGAAQVAAEGALQYATALYEIDRRLLAAGLKPRYGAPGTQAGVPATGTAVKIPNLAGFGNIIKDFGGLPKVQTPVGAGATGGTGGVVIGGGMWGFGTGSENR